MGQVWRATSVRHVHMSPEQARGKMKANAGTDQTPSMVVVLNWLEELKAKLPAK